MRRTSFGRLAIAIALVAAALAALVFVGTRRNLTYYYEIDELEAAAPAGRAERIRVSGDVVEGSIVRDEAERTIRFAIADAAADGRSSGRTLDVVYSGPIPDIFRPGIQVVVEGRIDEAGTFQAETLLAKCPSKYQAAGELDAGPPPRS